MRRIAQLLYAIVRFLIPTCGRQVAFESSPDCSDNSYAVFQHLLNNFDGLRIVWLVKDVVAARRVLAGDYSDDQLKPVQIVRKNSFRGLYKFLRSRYVFFTHRSYWFARSAFHQKIVNLWHGMPIKTIGELVPASSRIRRIRIPFAQYSIATSNFFGDVVSTALAVPRENVFIVGLPRNEWLFQTDQTHFAVREERRKLVMWLPTFRTTRQSGVERTDSLPDASDPTAHEVLAALDNTLDGSGVLLLLKLHPADAKNDLSWPAFRNVRVFTDKAFRESALNVYKLLGVSDALVTDYSSVAIDYLLLDRPLGFFSPDKSAYKRGFVPGVMERLAGAGSELHSVEDLGAFLLNLPAAGTVSRDVAELHRQDLTTPARAILDAVGLSAKRTEAPDAALSSTAGAQHRQL